MHLAPGVLRLPPSGCKMPDKAWCKYFPAFLCTCKYFWRRLCAIEFFYSNTFLLKAPLPVNRALKWSKCISMQLNPPQKHLLSVADTYAIVMPPISESLKRSRNVPLGLSLRMRCRCCFPMKPNINLADGISETLGEHGSGGRVRHAAAIASPFAPVVLQMLLGELHHSLEPLPEREGPTRENFLQGLQSTVKSRSGPAVSDRVCWGSLRACCHHLVELGPGDRHVAEVVGKVGLVEDLLGQEVLVVLVQIVARLDLGGEFAVESVVHHPPGDSLRHHERHSVLVAETKGRYVNDSHSSQVIKQEGVCYHRSFKTRPKIGHKHFEKILRITNFHVLINILLLMPLNLGCIELLIHQLSVNSSLYLCSYLYFIIMWASGRVSNERRRY